MKTSIIKNKNKIYIVLSVVFWLFIWQILSEIINIDYLLASPKTVLIETFNLIQTNAFWQIIFRSITKIMFGFILSVLIAVLLAIISYKIKAIKIILSPLIVVIKTTPVVSFIILALLWVKSENLSIFISFLMVLPITYNNVLIGIEKADKNLLEMAEIYKMTTINKVFYIFLPSVMPYLIAAIKSALGICWKAGISAEVIATPNNTIGEMLYMSKLNLDTEKLFAWTIIVIILSIIFEKAIIYLLSYINKKLEVS